MKNIIGNITGGKYLWSLRVRLFSQTPEWEMCPNPNKFEQRLVQYIGLLVFNSNTHLVVCINMINNRITLGRDSTVRKGISKLE